MPLPICEFTIDSAGRPTNNNGVRGTSASMVCCTETQCDATVESHLLLCHPRTSDRVKVPPCACCPGSPSSDGRFQSSRTVQPIAGGLQSVSTPCVSASTAFGGVARAICILRPFRVQVGGGVISCYGPCTTALPSLSPSTTAHLCLKWSCASEVSGTTIITWSTGAKLNDGVVSALFRRLFVLDHRNKFASVIFALGRTYSWWQRFPWTRTVCFGVRRVSTFSLLRNTHITGNWIGRAVLVRFWWESTPYGFRSTT